MSNIKRDHKSKIQTQQQFIYTLANAIEMYPQYTIAQHLLHFLRKKNEPKEPYSWEDELLLKKVEDYYDELNSDLAKNN